MMPLIELGGPELELMFRSARTRQHADNAHRIRKLAADGLDWRLFLESVERSHVAPLVNRTFQELKAPELPRKVVETLRVRTKIITWKNQRFADELARLDQRLQASGLDVMHYKGVVAALRLYGDIRLRTYNDLDFLVRRDQLKRVLRELERQGYRKAHVLNQAESEHSEREFKEYLYVRDDYRIEPHWSITARRYPFHIDYGQLWSRSHRQSLNGASLRVLAPEDECHLLCIACGKGRWKRYQMVTDVAQRVKPEPALDWDLVFADARMAGSERIVLLALLMAAELAEAPVPEWILRRARTSRSIARLAKRAVPSFRGPVPVPRFLPPSPHIVRRDLLLMRERPADRLIYLWRTTTTPMLLHRRMFRLPRWLNWLYVPFVPAYDYLAYPTFSVVQHLFPTLGGRLKSILRREKRQSLRAG